MKKWLLILLVAGAVHAQDKPRDLYGVNLFGVSTVRLARGDSLTQTLPLSTRSLLGYSPSRAVLWVDGGGVCDDDTLEARVYGWIDQDTTYCIDTLYLPISATGSTMAELSPTFRGGGSGLLDSIRIAFVPESHSAGDSIWFYAKLQLQYGDYFNAVKKKFKEFRVELGDSIAKLRLLIPDVSGYQQDSDTSTFDATKYWTDLYFMQWSDSTALLAYTKSLISGLGSPNLDAVGNPVASKNFLMHDNSLTFTYERPTNGMVLDFGDRVAGYGLYVYQHDATPDNTVELVRIEATDNTVIPLHVVGTNDSILVVNGGKAFFDSLDVGVVTYQMLKILSDLDTSKLAFLVDTTTFLAYIKYLNGLKIAMSDSSTFLAYIKYLDGLKVVRSDSDVVFVTPSFGVYSGTGITGGGNFTTDRTINVNGGWGLSMYADSLKPDTTSGKLATQGFVTSQGYLTAETGDISAVTAGRGITGGGTTGAVTVGLDTTLAYTWGGAMTFSGNCVNTANPWAVNEGGTGAATFTAHSLLLGQTASAITALGAATNGQIPIGSTGADPVLAAIVGTTGQIKVTNSAGGITIGLQNPACCYMATKTGAITGAQYLLKPGDATVMSATEGYPVAYGCTIDRLAGYINFSAKTADGTCYLVVRKSGAALDSVAITTSGVAKYQAVDSTNTGTFNPNDQMEMAINFGTVQGTIRDIYLGVYVK
jgi:hypothetical protein